MTLIVGAQRVSEGGTVALSGTVTDAAGEPMAHEPVVLQSRTDSTWHTLGRLRTNAGGSVSLTSSALVSTTRFRFKAPGARSIAVKVVVDPALAASFADGTITVTTNSVRAGDRVVLVRRTDGVQSSALVDSSGHAVFPVVAGATRTVYAVKLIATAQHGSATVLVVVPHAPSPPA